MFIDSHCHLEMKPLIDDTIGVIQRAKAVGVNKIISVGTDVKSSKQAIALASKYPEILPTVGAHPEFANRFNLADYQQLSSLARDPSVIAIGEIGLDFYRLEKAGKFSDLANKEEQAGLFEKMIDLAIENTLPIIVHSRDSARETLQVVQSYKSKLTGGVFHCFSYNLELSRRFLDTGFYLSFTNIIGYKKNQHLREVVKFTPIERILAETDAPFLPPEARRGQSCEPADVFSVIETIAEVKNISITDVAAQLQVSEQKLFQLNYS